VTQPTEREPDLPGLSPNDADRDGAGSGTEPSEESGAGYGNHAPGYDGEPGDRSGNGD